MDRVTAADDNDPTNPELWEKCKAKARERQREERMKRTRKGQPIMATQIKNILGKLTAERAAAASASSTG